jgi:hypothetical protein
MIFNSLGLRHWCQLHALAHIKHLSTVSTFAAFQHLACHYFTHHKHLMAQWVDKLCSTGVEAWNTCWDMATEPRSIYVPWPITTATFPPTAPLENAAASGVAQPLHLCLIQGVYGWC